MSGRSWQKAKASNRARRGTVRPATPAQLRLIATLADEVGSFAPSRAMTVHEASEEIDALLSRKRLGLFGQAATSRRDDR